MIKRILTLFSAVVLLGIFFIPSGCVKEDFDTTPPLENVATWNKTVTIAQLNALYVDKAGIVKKLANAAFWDAVIAQGGVDSSVVFEGYVISSDSASNFYETVTIMDETGGIEFKINSSEIYLKYNLKPGQKVLVRANDLALDKYNGVYQLGLAITDVYNGNNIIKVDKLLPSDVSKNVQLSGRKVSLDPIKLKISEITDEHVSKLVTIDSVQFWNPGLPFSIDGETTNRIVIDKHGNQIALRNSGFAKFKNEILPSGSGSITGVLSTYGTTRQFYIRDLNDIKFTDPRFGDAAPVVNKTIAQLKAYNTGSSPVQITGEFVIQGMVVANDENGNIYQSLCIQDETGAIEYKIYTTMLYADFPVGTIVTVNCSGLYVGKSYGVTKLGGLDGSYLGNLAPDLFYKSIYITGSGEPIAPLETTIPEINDSMLGKVILLSGVQFLDGEVGRGYSETSATTDRSVEDGDFNKIVVRNSNRSTFATSILPSGRGTVKALLGKYSVGSTSYYQLYLQKVTDVQMNGPRVLKALSQDFTAATVNSPISVGGWQTIAEAGTKVWNAKQYSGDTYAEMNPYQSGEASNIAWLVSPKVTIPAGVTYYLMFESQYNFWANSTLKAYILTNYDGSSPWNATMTELTEAVIVTQADGTNKWVKSGKVDLSAFSGEVYIAFKYTGSGTQTTAYRIDDVTVFQ